MAITKNNIADFIRDTELGGDPTLSGKIHPTIVWKAADIAIGKVIEMSMYKDDKDNGYEINGEFISQFPNENNPDPITIKEDEYTGEKYSDLPTSLISLKQDRGLVRVSEMKNLENAFSINGNTSNDVFAILDIHYLNTKTEARVQGTRIYYRNLGLAVEKVVVRMVSGISHLGGDDPIPIPGSLEYDFIKLVTDLLISGKVTTQDKYNDNNPNIPTP
jgi:hypothetical protein